MIELEIPKDIRKYEAKTFGPFTTRQLICFVIACVISIGVYKGLGAFVPQDLCFFIILIIVSPVLLCGWFKPYGMPFEKFVQATFVSMILAPKVRKYVIENIYYNKYQEERIAQQKDKKKKQVKSKPSKNKSLTAYE